jgi:cyanophycinase
MRVMPKTFLLFVTSLLFGVQVVSQEPASYKYYRDGNSTDAQTKTQAGFALMGGGDDLDEAFKWLCGRSGGGDFLVLTASDSKEYNSYVRKLCHVNSVSTLVIPDRSAADTPAVAETIKKAEAIFISGGDQANYVNWWMRTLVNGALNYAIRRGIPLGGTSAGLAVQGEFLYSAQADKPEDKDLSSAEVLHNPYSVRVTIIHNFLINPLLAGVITDTHFSARDRMGRLLGFMARILQDGRAAEMKAIAVDERTSVLLDPDGNATVVGNGAAYFLNAPQPPEVCKPDTPLTFHNISVRALRAGEKFNVQQWTGKDGIAYTLAVESGVVKSSNGAVYISPDKKLLPEKRPAGKS